MAYDLNVLVKQLDILRKKDDGRLRVLIETRTSEVQAQFSKVASLVREGDREAVSQMAILEDWLSLLGAITTHLGAGTMEDLFPGIGEMVLDWESKASAISERIKALESNGAVQQDGSDDDERSDSDADEEARNEAELAIVASGGIPALRQFVAKTLKDADARLEVVKSTPKRDGLRMAQAVTRFRHPVVRRRLPTQTVKHARSTSQRKLKQAVRKFGDRAIEKAAPQAGTRISEAKQELQIRRNAARKELDKFLGQEEEPNDTQKDESTVQPAGGTDAPNPSLKAYKCPHPGGKCGNTKQVLEDDVLRKRRDVDEDFEGDRRCNTCIQAGRTCNGSGCYRCNPCSDKGSACSHSKGHTSATKRPRGTEKRSRQRVRTTATPERAERPIRQLPKRAAKPSVGSLSEETMESRPVVRNEVDLGQLGQVNATIQSEDILRMDRKALEEVIRKENQRFTSLTVEIQDCYARTTTAMERLQNLQPVATTAQSVFVEIPVPVARLRNTSSGSHKTVSSSVGNANSGEDEEEEWGGISEGDEDSDDEMADGDPLWTKM